MFLSEAVCRPYNSVIHIIHLIDMGVIPFHLPVLSAKPRTVLTGCRPSIKAFDRAIKVDCTIIIACLSS